MLHKLDLAGKALLEFAILLPFLFLLAAFAFDCFKAFHNFQYLSVIAREIGNASFRNCSTMLDDTPAPGPTTMSDCVGQVAGTALNYVNSAKGVLPGSQAIIRVYRVNHNSSTSPATPLNPTLAGGYNINGSLGGTSKYNDNVIRSLHSYVPEKGTIVTTEVFFSDNTTLSFFSNSYYETTIF